MKKTAEKGKKIVFGVLLVLACILIPQKMTDAAEIRCRRQSITLRYL